MSLGQSGIGVHPETWYVFIACVLFVVIWAVFLWLIFSQRERKRVMHLFEPATTCLATEGMFAHLPADEGRAQFRDVTVLFAEFRGFTLAQDNQDVGEILASADKTLSTMLKLGLSYEAVVTKFMGNSFLAIFGAMGDCPNGEERAVRLAYDMQKALRQINLDRNEKGMTPVFMSIGVASGEALIAQAGKGRERQFAALGDPVTFATRLQALADRNQVLLTEKVYNKVRDMVEVILWDMIYLEARVEPIRVYEVMGLVRGLPLERRRFLRARTMIPVMYKPESGGEFQEQTADIGGGGLRMVSRNPLKEGESLKLNFELPTGERIENITGKVLDVEELDTVEDDYRYIIRVEFKNMSEKDREKVIRFVYAQKDMEEAVKQSGGDLSSVQEKNE